MSLTTKRIEELKLQKNVAIVIVSSNQQDVQRQVDEFKRFTEWTGITFEYVRVKNRKRTQMDRACIDILSKYGQDINQWRESCSRYGTADTWNRTYITLKDAFKAGELGRIRCFVLESGGVEITDPANSQYVSFKFQDSTRELEDLSTRILSKKGQQTRAGENTHSELPFPFDEIRYTNQGQVHIHQLRSGMTRYKKGQLGPKWEIVYPTGEIVKTNNLPHKQRGEHQKFVITKDKNRIDIIYFFRDWIKTHNPINLNKCAKEIQDKYGDSWGLGWSYNRLRDLAWNPAISGRASTGKSSHADLPSLIIRDPNSPTGYTFNEDEIAGKMPESSWIISDVIIDGLLTIEEQEFIKNKIQEDDKVRFSKKEAEDAVRIAKGLPPKKYNKNPNHWLKGILWDVIDNEALLVRKDKCICSTRCIHEKFKHRNRGCGVSAALKPMHRVIQDYISLAGWNNLCDFDKLLAAVSTGSLSSCFDCVKEMGRVICLGLAAAHKFFDMDSSLWDNLVAKIDPTPLSKINLSLCEENCISFEDLVAFIPKDNFRSEFLELYSLCLQIVNLDKNKRLEELTADIARTTTAIVKGGYSDALSNALKIQEAESKTIQEELSQSLLPEFLSLEKGVQSLKSKIQQLQIGHYDEVAVESLFNEQEIKIYVNGNRGEDFITIKSESHNVPQLVVSWEDWRKKYIVQSLANRPQHFQKGHSYHPKQNNACNEAVELVEA